MCRKLLDELTSDSFVLSLLFLSTPEHCVVSCCVAGRFVRSAKLSGKEPLPRRRSANCIALCLQLPCRLAI